MDKNFPPALVPYSSRPPGLVFWRKSGVCPSISTEAAGDQCVYARHCQSPRSRANVIHKQTILAAKEKLAAGDSGIGPGLGSGVGKLK